MSGVGIVVDDIEMELSIVIRQKEEEEKPESADICPIGMLSSPSITKSAFVETVAISSHGGCGMTGR